MRHAAVACLILAILLPAAATAGIVIVNHDEWPLSDYNPYASQLAVNIANYFAGGPGGNFLIYSNNFGLYNGTLFSALSSAGHSYTASVSVPFDLPTLSAFTGVFLGGYLGSYDPAVLRDYVNAGGNVYLAAGTAAIANEDTVWDSFLASFGFEFGPSYNYIAGPIAPSSPHPIFAGVPDILYVYGNTVILTGSTSLARLIAVDPETGAGLIGIYEGQPEAAIPEPSAAPLLALGLLAVLRLRRR